MTDMDPSARELEGVSLPPTMVRGWVKPRKGFVVFGSVLTHRKAKGGRVEWGLCDVYSVRDSFTHAHDSHVSTPQPLLVIRNRVLFPGGLLRLSVGKPRSIKVGGYWASGWERTEALGTSPNTHMNLT